MTRLVDNAVYLSKGGMAFRGHDESDESCQQVNFKELFIF